MVSDELQRHLDEQARALFAAAEGKEGGYEYEAACAMIPRCGQMLVPRYTVQHLAYHVRALRTSEELSTFLRGEATRDQRILIAWAFVRISKALGPDYEIVRSLPFIYEERLLQMDSLNLCQVGFWLHLIAWPESYCPSERDSDCGTCPLEPAK